MHPTEEQNAIWKDMQLKLADTHSKTAPHALSEKYFSIVNKNTFIGFAENPEDEKHPKSDILDIDAPRFFKENTAVFVDWIKQDITHTSSVIQTISNLVNDNQEKPLVSIDDVADILYRSKSEHERFTVLSEHMCLFLVDSLLDLYRLTCNEVKQKQGAYYLSYFLEHMENGFFSFGVNMPVDLARNFIADIGNDSFVAHATDREENASKKHDSTKHVFSKAFFVRNVDVFLCWIDDLMKESQFDSRLEFIEMQIMRSNYRTLSYDESASIFYGQEIKHKYYDVVAECASLFILNTLASAYVEVNSSAYQSRLRSYYDVSASVNRYCNRNR